MNITAKIILVERRILLFSFPKSFEVKSDVTVDGITAKLIIWIAEIASTYSGKIMGIMKGANDIVNMVIIMDENNAKSLIFVVVSPTESCGSVYR